MRVCDLINVDNREWDEQLIAKSFWPVIVQRILDIPLAMGMMEDFVSWHYNMSGMFLVKKRAYHAEWKH